MKVKIRKEEKRDYQKVFELIQNAFENVEFSDHREQYLVERLKNSDTFIPELSLVAEIDNQIVGYILLSKISVLGNTKNIHTSLAMLQLRYCRGFRAKVSVKTLLSLLMIKQKN